MNQNIPIQDKDGNSIDVGDSLKSKNSRLFVEVTKKAIRHSRPSIQLCFSGGNPYWLTKEMFDTSSWVRVN